MYQFFLWETYPSMLLTFPLVVYWTNRESSLDRMTLDGPVYTNIVLLGGLLNESFFCRQLDFNKHLSGNRHELVSRKSSVKTVRTVTMCLHYLVHIRRLVCILSRPSLMLPSLLAYNTHCTCDRQFLQHGSQLHVIPPPLLQTLLKNK